jgi:protein TonB
VEELPPPPPPEPVPVEEPPPVIESTAAETVAEPPPPPKVERPPERKPKPKPVRRRTLPPPPERPPVPVEAVVPAQPAPPPPVTAPVAPQTAMAAPAGHAGPPPDYLALLHRALERSKEYPRAARQRRQQGRAMLRFAIDRAGNVLNYRIEKSTGYATLDRAVVAMIERASPLPPIPADMAGDRLEVVVPIPFVLH